MQHCLCPVKTLVKLTKIAESEKTEKNPFIDGLRQVCNTIPDSKRIRTGRMNRRDRQCWRKKFN